MIGITTEDKMDMAKYKCTILHSYSDYANCPDFPNFEEKWSRNMANGKPYEIRFDLANESTVDTMLYIFDDEESKALFIKDYPNIVEQIKF